MTLWTKDVDSTKAPPRPTFLVCKLYFLYDVDASLNKPITHTM